MLGWSRKGSDYGGILRRPFTFGLPLCLSACLTSLLFNLNALHAANEALTVKQSSTEPESHFQEPILPRPFSGLLLPASTFSRYELPPQRITTTLNIDGMPTTVSILGTTYNGVRLTHIGMNSLAGTAGLKLEDILLSLNEHNTVSPESADRILNRMPSGDLRIGFARKVDGQAKVMETRVRYFNPMREQKRRYYLQPMGQEHPAPLEPADMLEAKLLTLMNSDRLNALPKVKLAPFKVSPKLGRLARDYADAMARQGFFSDKDPKGRDLAWRAGSLGLAGDVAESAVCNVASVEEAETLFMSEPPDNPNNRRGHILDPRFAYVGAGVARSENDSLVVVQLFSARPPAGE